MRTAAAIVFGLALASRAFAANGAPSDEVLAQMGLSGIQVMSDSDVAGVRGMGYFGFDGFALYKDGLRDYHKQMKDFHTTVKKFQRNHLKPRHQKTDGMKPPKMDHQPKMPKMDHRLKMPKMPKMDYRPMIW